MSEKLFRVRFGQEDGRGEIVNEKGVELTSREVVDLLNEQQSTIEVKDKEIAELDQQCAEFLGDNIKALDEFEECTDKLKQKILEQQATINKLTDEKEYWKNKAMTLLFQVCRLTPRMTDAEVKGFSKELENE